MKIRLRSVLTSARLISRVIKKMNVEPQDIQEVLSLVNAYTKQRFKTVFAVELGVNINNQFEIVDRGYDVSLKFPPGYPTVFIKHLPTGELFKVGCDPRIDAILDEWGPSAEESIF